MSLKHSENLIRTPDFTGAPNLEQLILEGCTRLHEIHPVKEAHAAAKGAAQSARVSQSQNQQSLLSSFASSASLL